MTEGYVDYSGWYLEMNGEMHPERFKSRADAKHKLQEIQGLLPGTLLNGIVGYHAIRVSAVEVREMLSDYVSDEDLRTTGFPLESE